MNEKKLVHAMRMPIRWGDMDTMGHVNNTVYFRYFEQARIEWFMQLGTAADPTCEFGPVIINAHCVFLKQLRYPGEIEVATFLGAVGRSSFETIQEIRRVDQLEVIAASGGAKVVWIDYAAEKSIALPDSFRARLHCNFDANRNSR
ncbi:MAG: thioesterase family protein [Burkholderiaceae bacterium]